MPPTCLLKPELWLFKGNDNKNQTFICELCCVDMQVYKNSEIFVFVFFQKWWGLRHLEEKFFCLIKKSKQVFWHWKVLSSSNQSISQCAAGSNGCGPVGTPTNWPPVDASCFWVVNWPPNWSTCKIPTKSGSTSNLIDKRWLQLSISSFKIKCKDKFLK